MRTYLTIILFGLLSIWPHSIVLGQNGKCQIARGAIDDASDIRGLRSKQSVPCLVHERDEVRAYLLSIIDKQLPPAKLSNEEFVYKKLGFFPESFDYKKGIVELYLSQIGGYYDPEKNHYVMAGWLPDQMQTGIAVHELTHALQDQYYDLEKIVDLSLSNSDALLARSAFIEGDATAVMFDYQRLLTGQKPLASEASIDSLVMGSVASLSLTTSAGNVPKSLQMLLMFPYTSGLRFAHSILRKGGYAAMSKVYSNLPRSTEEILHPEIYGTPAGELKIFGDQELRTESMPSELTIQYSDTLGEFGTSALLTMLGAAPSTAGEASRGWGGDRIVLFSDSSKSKGVIVWRSSWDTLKDAEEICEALRTGYAKSSPPSNGKLTCQNLEVQYVIEF